MTLSWRNPDPTHLRSDPDGFTIVRATVHGAYTYSAVRLGKRWTSYTPPGQPIKEGWEGSEVIAIERDIPIDDEDARRAAAMRLQVACEQANV